MRTAILDTNVLLHSPDALDSFRDKGYDTIVIPLSVVEELDNHKRRQDDAGRNARKAIKAIDKLQLSRPKHKGGTTIRIESNESMSFLQLMGMMDLDPDKPDNRLIALAVHLRGKGEEVVVITNDSACRIKARHFGVESESFEQDRVHVEMDDLYGGVATVEVPGSVIDELYANSSVQYDGALFPNQFVILKDECNSRHTGLGRFMDGKILKLQYVNVRPWDISPKNVEQVFLQEALMQPDIHLVTCIGRAGTGKTLVTIAAGGYQVVEQKLYKRFIYYKAMVPIGRDIGFLPGEEKEKLRPWMASAYDAFEFILGSEDKLEHLIERKLVELSTLTYIRGRSLPQLFIVLDEASNMTPNEIKTLISRAGEGTKIVLIGDPYQIDHPYLDWQNNGLVYTMERFKGQKIFAHVTLSKPERSTLSGLAAELL